MSNMSKELLREYIKEQNFTSPNEILNALKDMFRDVLQESLEAEMTTFEGSSTFTMALTAPLVTSVTLPINLFLALNFISISPHTSFI